jgi:hypothetical protein
MRELRESIRRARVIREQTTELRARVREERELSRERFGPQA